MTAAPPEAAYRAGLFGVGQGDTVCEVPERSWRSSLRPQRVVLATVALAIIAYGLWLGDLAGLGVAAVGGGLALAAVVLPTVREVEFGFPVGVMVRTATRSREEELRQAFGEQRGELELCAQLMCDDPATASRLLEAAWSRAATDWRGPVGPYLRVFVLCSLVELVLAHERWTARQPKQLPLEPSRPLAALRTEARIVVVLHDFARLSMAEVAALTRREVADVVAVLDQGVALLPAHPEVAP